MDCEVEYLYTRYKGDKCSGFTLLMKLVILSNKHIELLKTYTSTHDSASIGVNKQNKHGWSALMLACIHLHDNSGIVIELLLKAGANIHLQNDDGKAALFLLICNIMDSKIHTNGVNNECKEHVTRLLLSAGGMKAPIESPIMVTDNNMSELMIACSLCTVDFDVSVIELLLESCLAQNGDKYTTAYVNRQDHDGDTALMIACYNINVINNDRLIKLLLESNIDVNICNNRNDNALMNICGDSRLSNKINSNTNNIQLLFDAGIDINHQNKNGFTSLMMLCASYMYFISTNFIMKLLSHPKINIHMVCDIFGHTALTYACKTINPTYNDIIPEWEHRKLLGKITDNVGKIVEILLRRDANIDNINDSQSLKLIAGILNKIRKEHDNLLSIKQLLQDGFMGSEAIALNYLA